MILTTLEEAFDAIAPHLNLEPLLLMRFANEDNHGGRDTGHFPPLMSPYRAEGQFLYALIRAMKPERVLEIGCGDGGSATHILAALEANQYGKLVSVDVQSRHVGHLIPAVLRGRWELLTGDARDYPLPVADLVFEDADHTFDTTLTILTRLKLMSPKCVVSHDYVWEIGVKQAFDQVFGEDITTLNLGNTHTETGLGVWFNPL